MIINFFAGPGAGKTAMALSLTHHLKRLGASVIYVSEVAVDYIIEDNLNPLKFGQPYVISQQLYRQENAERNYEIVVVDSPIVLGVMYNNDKNEKAKTHFNNFILEKFLEKDNVNFFINRNKYFTQTGRIHNLEQSKQLDIIIKDFLKEKKIPFDEIESKPEGTMEIVEKLISQLFIQTISKGDFNV